jgi:hypothetical protein
VLDASGDVTIAADTSTDDAALGDGDVSIGSDARSCDGGGWCLEAHEGAAGAASAEDIAQFAGPVTQPPIAAFRRSAWATRDASTRWTYSAYPAPAGDESSAAAVLRGFAAPTSWVGVANGAVYHWSPSQGIRGFSTIAGATPLAAVARSAEELWVVVTRPPTMMGSPSTVHARLWRAGAWSEVLTNSSGSWGAVVVGVALDADGALLLLQYTRQPPGYLVYTVDRVADTSGAPDAALLRIQTTSSGPDFGPGSIVRDSANGLWIAAGGQLWHRAPGASRFAQRSMPLRASRVLSSERGVAVVFAASVSPRVDALAELDVGTEVVSPRAIDGASIRASGLHVTNAALWRADGDATFWRLSSR